MQISQVVFDDVATTGRFDLLQSTRHFGSLCYYLALNEQLAPLLEYFANAKRYVVFARTFFASSCGSCYSLNAAADVVRLYYAVFPDWRRGDTLSVPDHQLVESYLKQHKRDNSAALRKLLNKQ